MTQDHIRNFCIIAHIEQFRDTCEQVSRRAGKKARLFVGLLFPVGGAL